VSEPLLQVQGLSAGYGEVQVLWSIDLIVGAREIVALIGSNGAGKTTILKVLSGLLGAASGTLCFRGESIEGASPKEIVARGLVHVPEGRRLFRGMSVLDNLMVGAYRRRDGRAAITRSIDRVFTLFPRLAERRRQDASTLSGGEQQMCAIARGLMAAPRLLLIDELSLGLAPSVVDEVVQALERINAEGTSLLVVEQDVMTALELSDRVYVVDQGRTTLSGPSEQVGKDPAIRTAYLGL
jgi:branched-chain amino acid transport system ATP-binding protein